MHLGNLATIRYDLNQIYFFFFFSPMESTLLRASLQGNLSTVEEILRSGKANINVKNICIQKSLINFQFKYFIIFAILSNLWNRIPIFNCTPLHAASSEGHTEIVRLLLSQPDIEINCQDI